MGARLTQLRKISAQAGPGRLDGRPIHAVACKRHPSTAEAAGWASGSRSCVQMPPKHGRGGWMGVGLAQLRANATQEPDVGDQVWPVWPKPPPRSSPLSEVTTFQRTSSTRWMTSWAMRSPRWIDTSWRGSVFSRIT